MMTVLVRRESQIYIYSLLLYEDYTRCMCRLKEMFAYKTTQIFFPRPTVYIASVYEYYLEHCYSH